MATRLKYWRQGRPSNQSGFRAWDRERSPSQTGARQRFQLSRTEPTIDHKEGKSRLAVTVPLEAGERIELKCVLEM